MMLQRGMRTPQLGTLVPRILIVWCVGGWNYVYQQVRGIAT